MARRKKSKSVNLDDASDGELSVTAGSALAQDEQVGSSETPKTSGRKIEYHLTNAQDLWLRSYCLAFISKISSRGSKGDNAKTYVTKVLTPKFIAHFHEGEDLNNDRGRKMVDDVDYAIYVRLSNKYKKEKKKLKKADDPNCKACPRFEWAEAHPDEVAAEIKKDLRANSQLKDDIGLWQRVVSRLYDALPPQEKGKWANQAVRDKAQKIAMANAKEPLMDEEQMKYVRDYCVRMEALIKEGERVGGINTLVHFGAKERKEGVNGEMKEVVNVTSIMNPSSRGYNRTKDFVDGEERYGVYLAEVLGAPVEKKLSVAVTPAEDGQPEIPDLPDNPVLSLLRTLVRSAMKGHWMYAAGQGPVPWTEIAREIAAGNYEWIEQSRLPSTLLPNGKRVRFVDPHEMTIDECIIWLRHLKRRQLGETNTAIFFQFQQAYTSLNHTFPEYIKVLRKTSTRRSHNQNVLLVKYEGYLDRPATYEPILYKQESWDYFYRDTGKSGLFHWLGLPSRPKAPVPLQITDSELEIYREWFDTIKETQGDVYDKLFSTLELVNRLDRGVPIIAKDELWSLANGRAREVPLAIPQTPPSAVQLQEWLATPWIASYLMAAHEAGKIGSAISFEEWQHRQRSGPLYHPHSKTFRGGKLGIAWLIRGLVKHMATIGGATGVLELPKAAPSNCEPNRVSRSDWDRAALWLASWHELLEDACKVLESTVRERLQPALSPTSSNDTGDCLGSAAQEPSSAAADSTTDGIDDRNMDLEPTRTSLPRRAKLSVSYIDPFAEAEEAQDITSDSEGLPESDLSETDAGSEVERRLPPMLKTIPARAVNFEERQAALGPRPEIRPTVAYSADPVSILAGVEAFFKRTTEVFGTYRSMKSQYGLPYTTKMRTWIHDFTVSMGEPRRHLVSTILLQRLTWRQAQHIWPHAKQQYQEFWECRREGSSLRAAIKDSKAAKASGPAMDSIILQEDELYARIWACRLMFEQFTKFRKLSTCWANKLEDGFLTVSLDLDEDDLLPIVAGIRDWRRDFSIVVQDQRAYRKEVDEQYQIDEYVPLIQDLWYWYGNPTGFVLCPAASAILNDIPISTLIEEEEDEKSEEGEKEAGRDEARILGSQSLDNTAATSTSADQGAKCTETPAHDIGNSMDESRSGPSGTNASSNGSLVSTKGKMSRPRPRPRPPPETGSPPTSASTPPHVDDRSLSDPPISTETHPTTTPSPSKSPAQPDGGNKVISSLSPTKPTRRTSTKLTPVIELPKKGAAFVAKAGAVNGGSHPLGSLTTERKRPVVQDTSSKKRAANASHGATSPKRRKSEKSTTGNGEVGVEGTGSVDTGVTTRPKRTRVPTARALGIH